MGKMSKNAKVAKVCIELIAVKGIPVIDERVNLAELLITALEANEMELQENDIMVISHSLVSKSEGRTIRAVDVQVSQKALEIAKKNGFDPIHVELALRECVDIIRDKGVLITETHHGLVCNFSGVDKSNAPEGSYILLPEDPDESASRIRERLQAHFRCNIAVIISDTQGRPWRKGSVNVTIGCSGINAFKIYRGKKDIYDYILRRSIICHVDEIASAVEPIMGEADEGVPVVIVRGYVFEDGPQHASSIPRHRSEDMFR